MTILTLNAGSSSLKFGLFRPETGELHREVHGSLEDLDGQPRFLAFDADGTPVTNEALRLEGHEHAISHLLHWLRQRFPHWEPTAAGHRVVHGGTRYRAPVRVDKEVLRRLRGLIPLAPLHMPHNLAAMEALDRERPGIPQVACFDTAFHHTMPEVEQRYAVARDWYARGGRRYGFHGLSYEYIASVLPDHLGDRADGRVVVAHLGHGASLCALHHRRSVATTMGFTPLEGVPMATRPGPLDPGLVPWLIREQHLDVQQVEQMLNHHSGLLGLSGISGDVRELLADTRRDAGLAIDHFVYHVRRAIASLAAVLEGLDAVVFTAGIGENSAEIRRRICAGSDWIGIRLDEEANAHGRPLISRPGSAVQVWVIPTDEEQVIARHTRRLVAEQTA